MPDRQRVLRLLAVIALAAALLGAPFALALSLLVVALVAAELAADALRSRAAAAPGLHARLAQLEAWVTEQDHPDWDRYERLVAEAYAQEDRRQHCDPDAPRPRPTPRPAECTCEGDPSDTRNRDPDCPACRPVRSRRRHVVYCNCSPENQARGLPSVCNYPGPCAAERARWGPGKSDHALKPAVDIAQGVSSAALGLWQISRVAAKVMHPRPATRRQWHGVRTANEQALERRRRLTCSACGGSGTLLFDGQAMCVKCGHLGTPKPPEEGMATGPERR